MPNVHVSAMDGLGLGSFGTRLLNVRGLSGLGAAAICPSLKQLQGVADPSDPCQAAAVTNAVAAGVGAQNGGASYSTVTTPAGDYQVFSNGTIFDPSGKQVSSIPGYLAGISYMTWAMVGGGAFLLFLLLGRRR